MKKILIAAAVIAAVSMASCGGKESAAVKDNESAIKAKIENCTNPDSLSLYVDQAKAYAQKLVQEGKVDEAKKYLDQITPVVQDKAPALAGILETVKTTLDKVPGSAEAAADSAGTKAGAAVDSLKSAGSQAVDAAKQKGSEVVESAKEKGAEVVDAAKDKAADAADKAGDAIKHALGK